MQFSEQIEKCGLSPMRKFHPYAVAAKKRGIKVYHLNIGQPDIETPPAFFEAIRTFHQATLAYAPSPGIPELAEKVCGYYDKLGVHYTPDDVLITTGGSEALSIAMHCILNPGDEVIIPEPFYPNYNTFVRTAGGVVRPLKTSVEDGYRYVDREKLEALVNEHTRAIMFTNPGNPTGAVITKAEMRVLADFAKEHDLFIIGDEVYREFVYGGEELLTIGMFDDIADRAIIIDSVSKRFSACGARIGALISKNKKLQHHAMKLCQSRLSVATLDQIASAALYDVGPEYFDAVREEYKRRRDTIYRKLKEIPGVVCAKPMGAFYVMAKLPVDDTDVFQQFMFEDFNLDGDTVMFAAGAGFYATPGSGFQEVRLAYTINCEDIERAIDVLHAGIDAYNAK